VTVWVWVGVVTLLALLAADKQDIIRWRDRWVDPDREPACSLYDLPHMAAKCMRTLGVVATRRSQMYVGGTGI
jgi:hypothetical protein